MTILERPLNKEGEIEGNRFTVQWSYKHEKPDGTVKLHKKTAIATKYNIMCADHGWLYPASFKGDEKADMAAGGADDE